MRQLSGIDAVFLQMETATTYAHVASLSVYEPAPGREAVTLPELRALVAARIHRVPVLRQRLLELPLEVDRPYWVDDPQFDLDRHVREAGLEAPVDDARLADWVSRVTARRLDRSRPLWELHLVRGLPGGRFALLGIVHHAAVDGIAGRDVLAVFLDREPDPGPDPEPPAWRPEPVPGVAGRLLRGVTGLAAHPWRVLELQQRVAQQAMTRVQEATRSAAQPFDLTRAWSGGSGGRAPAGAQGPLDRAGAGGRAEAALPAPRTPFNRPVTGRRSWAAVSLSRERVRAVRRAHGAGANDVVLALCAGALRRWLAGHGGVPARPLRAMVPVSVRARSGDDGAAGGNRVSFMVADLPTHEPDPLARLRAVSGGAREAKKGHDSMGVAAGLAGMADLVVPAFATAAVRAAHRMRVADWVDPAFNLVVSSVPGPQVPLHLRGSRLLHAYPVSVVTDGLGLNITVQTGPDSLDFGLTADRELVADLELLAGGLAEELAALEAAPAPEA